MPQNQSKAKFHHLNPQFLVTDVETAVAFYRDKLGFELEFVVGEPVVFAAMISKRDCDLPQAGRSAGTQPSVQGSRQALRRLHFHRQC